MTVSRLFLVAMACLLTAVKAGGDEPLQGEIRLQAATEGSVWVGQEVELNLDLMSTGFSFGGQQYSLPAVSGAFLLPADSNTVKLTETRAGQTWQILRYSFLLYPQREGQLRVPSFEVRYSANLGYGSAPVDFQFNTPALTIDARLPPGADRHTLVVTSTEFSLQSRWQPQLTEGQTLTLKTGDALKLTIERRAAGVPAMVFSPLPEFNIDGLRAYYDPPGINDTINRGKLAGRRTDSINFICEREGHYQIPDIRFQWWDPEREVLQEEVVKGVAIEVLTNPSFGVAVPDGTDSGRRVISWRYVLLLVILLAGLIFSIGPARRKLARWLEERRRLKESGESWAFEQVTNACNADQAHAAYGAISLWMTRCEDLPAGTTLLQLARVSGQPGLALEVERLQQSMISGPGGVWKGARLAQRLKEWRSGFNKNKGETLRLPPLNPLS